MLSNQVRYSLIDRGPETDLLGWAQDHDRIVIAYSPLSQGVLSGRYDADHVPAGMRASTPAFLPDNLARVGPVLSLLAEIARTHDATSAQVALAWLLRRPNVVVIPGASSIDQLARNAEASALELSEEEDGALSEASEAYHPIGGVDAAARIVRQRADRAFARLGRAFNGLSG